MYAFCNMLQNNHYYSSSLHKPKSYFFTSINPITITVMHTTIQNTKAFSIFTPFAVKRLNLTAIKEFPKRQNLLSYADIIKPIIVHAYAITGLTYTESNNWI